MSAARRSTSTGSMCRRGRARAAAALPRRGQPVSQLRERPQWYNALTDNCTTAIQRLARSGERQSWCSRKLLVNGYLDELAYDIGAIDRSLPFAVLHPQVMMRVADGKL